MGYIGIMEKKMETAVVYGGPIGMFLGHSPSLGFRFGIYGLRFRVWGFRIRV